MAFSIRFNEEKNQLLKATRQVGFDDVLLAIKNGRLLANISHPNPQWQHQKMFVVELNEYAYAVPYVIDNQKEEIFLKTIYPSRMFSKKYLQKDHYDQTSK